MNIRSLENRPNKKFMVDAADYAVATHGFAILCVATTPLLLRITWRYTANKMNL